MKIYKITEASDYLGVSIKLSDEEYYNQSVAPNTIGHKFVVKSLIPLPEELVHTSWKYVTNEEQKMSAPVSSYPTSSEKSSKKSGPDPAGLLAELATLHQRMGEITAQLQGLPAGALRADPVQVAPPDFDRQAYAVGLIWRNPSIPVRELGAKLGVDPSMLYRKSWDDVRRILRAREVDRPFQS